MYRKLIYNVKNKKMHLFGGNSRNSFANFGHCCPFFAAFNSWRWSNGLKRNIWGGDLFPIAPIIVSWICLRRWYLTLLHIYCRSLRAAKLMLQLLSVEVNSDRLFLSYSCSLVEEWKKKWDSCRFHPVYFQSRSTVAFSSRVVRFRRAFRAY